MEKFNHLSHPLFTITPKYKKLRGKFPNQPNTPARIKSKTIKIESR